MHGTILGIGERVGNTPMDLLLVNLVLMGWIERDLAHLNDLVQAVSEATGEPIPDNYPVFGRDAFRTATGVHAAAVVKAFHKGDEDLADTVYSGVPARLVGRSQQIEVGPHVGPVERASSGSSATASPPTTSWSSASSAAPRRRRPCSPSRKYGTRSRRRARLPAPASTRDAHALSHCQHDT